MVGLQPLTDEALKECDNQLYAIKEQLLHDSSAPLYAYRTENSFHPVIGEGSHAAKVMIVGEAPGLNEAKQGRPFCGASGKFLDALLEHIGLDRKTVYVTNVVKDRPPENRDPLPQEIEYYGPLLLRQFQIIKPEVIVTLGRYSMAYVLKTFGIESQLGPISALHGKQFKGLFEELKTTIVTLYHPAVALYNGSMRAVLLKDFEAISSIVK
jgi:DNA polymerase